MLIVFIQNVTYKPFKLSVIKLSVVILSVVAPKFGPEYRGVDKFSSSQILDLVDKACHSLLQWSLLRGSFSWDGFLPCLHMSEMTVSDKHASLLSQGINYCSKKFYRT